MQRGLIVDPNNNAWQTVLNHDRDAFMRDFVTRTEFIGLYPTTDTPAQYVDKLYLHAGITPTLSERWCDRGVRQRDNRGRCGSV